MEENKPTIGTVLWVKGLSDETLDALESLIDHLKEDDGWYDDEGFDLELRIGTIYKTVHREHLYRVGIALGIRPEKVNKTVGYLVED